MLTKNLPRFARSLARASPMPEVAPVMIINSPLMSRLQKHLFQMINLLKMETGLNQSEGTEENANRSMKNQ